MSLASVLLAALVASVAIPAAAESPAQGGRRFVFRYAFELPADLLAGGPLDVFVPLPTDSESQQTVREVVRSPLPGEIGREPTYGNRYWHARFDGAPAAGAAQARVEIELEVIRRPRCGAIAAAPPAPLFLAPNERVVVGHPVLEPILAEIRAASPGASPAQRARAIYDWVVDHMEYKKLGTGWGNGDTFWACSARYGNCTDFHSLFISLARTEGIPARFEMGFPVPTARKSGEIAGYHCWVEFYVPGEGWIPIDASEASKHKEKRDLFFGQQPTDRIQFTTGRDLRLGAAQHGHPLNYLIYPYLEQDGEAVRTAIPTHFSYRDLPSGEPAATGCGAAKVALGPVAR